MLHLFGWKVSLIIGPDTIFTRMESVLPNNAGYYIYYVNINFNIFDL